MTRTTRSSAAGAVLMAAAVSGTWLSTQLFAATLGHAPTLGETWLTIGAGAMRIYPPWAIFGWCVAHAAETPGAVVTSLVPLATSLLIGVGALLAPGRAARRSEEVAPDSGRHETAPRPPRPRYVTPVTHRLDDAPATALGLFHTVSDPASTASVEVRELFAHGFDTTVESAVARAERAESAHEAPTRRVARDVFGAHADNDATTPVIDHGSAAPDLDEASEMETDEYDLGARTRRQSAVVVPDGLAAPRSSEASAAALPFSDGHDAATSQLPPTTEMAHDDL